MASRELNFTAPRGVREAQSYLRLKEYAYAMVPHFGGYSVVLRRGVGRDQPASTRRPRSQRWIRTGGRWLALCVHRSQRDGPDRWRRGARGQILLQAYQQVCPSAQLVRADRAGDRGTATLHNIQSELLGQRQGLRNRLDRRGARLVYAKGVPAGRFWMAGGFLFC